MPHVMLERSGTSTVTDVLAQWLSKHTSTVNITSFFWNSPTATWSRQLRRQARIYILGELRLDVEVRIDPDFDELRAPELELGVPVEVHVGRGVDEAALVLLGHERADPALEQRLPQSPS